MTVRKSDPHAKPGRRPRVSKEGATFDTEQQRYFMPGERRATTTKQGEK